MVQMRDAETLGDLSQAIFLAAGATPENAEGVTRSLIGANLAGHDSHGVIRIPSYIADINNGKLRPANDPVRHARDTGDGDCGRQLDLRAGRRADDGDDCRAQGEGGRHRGGFRLPLPPHGPDRRVGGTRRA